jgi:hypothetical protein
MGLTVFASAARRVLHPGAKRPPRRRRSLLDRLLRRR